MANRSKLLKLTVKNIGCIGADGVEVALDNVVCLVGRNNAGKSTILKAYEFAFAPGSFSLATDRCRFAPEGEPSVVELDVHIPEGVANVGEEWKTTEGDYRVVRSRWEWATDGTAKRLTWSPADGEWSADGKAGGADNVFKARLPRPLRVGSLEDAAETEKTLLSLALSPFVTEMQAHQGDPESDLSKSVTSLISVVDKLSGTHEKRFEAIASKVHSGFSGVFPGLDIRLEVAMASPAISLDKLLKEGSGLRVKDRHTETSISQQGTGARRALFWAMLQVHNQMKREVETRAGLEKAAKGKKGDELVAAQAKIAAFDAGEKLPESGDDPAFPGYLLLIDEPENALHPMAARAAQRHLYDLAKDPEWQVIMTTHSPYFVNPLDDHTTIVRLERQGGEEGPIQPKTYSADDVVFDEDTKRNLQALQQMDVGFSEVFFGSYPIIVEGDTEHAAFMAAVVEPNHELASRVAIVRARGKAILPGIIRMLRHFRVPFGIIHDVDWPYTSKGKGNAMWGINKTIHDELIACRAAGVDVRHRCSVPDFERRLAGEELGKDKPLTTYLRVKGDPVLKAQVLDLMLALCESADHQPFPREPGDQRDYTDVVLAQLADWSGKNGHAENPRLTGIVPEPEVNDVAEK